MPPESGICIQVFYGLHILPLLRLEWESQFSLQFSLHCLLHDTVDLRLAGGRLTGRYCGLGLAGFPNRAPGRRHPGGSPLSPVLLLGLPIAGPDYHLVHTLIPVKLCISRQSRGFPRRFGRSLASFAEQVSSIIRYPPTPLKAGYTAHSTNGAAYRSNPSRSLVPTH
jgi:hypothetical protein